MTGDGSDDDDNDPSVPSVATVIDGSAVFSGMFLRRALGSWTRFLLGNLSGGNGETRPPSGWRSWFVVAATMDGGEALVPSSVFKASEADVGGVEAVEDSTVEAKALDTTDDPDVLLDLTESGLLVALVVSAFLLSSLLLLWSGLLSMLRIAEANLVEAPSDGARFPR